LGSRHAGRPHVRHYQHGWKIDLRRTIQNIARAFEPCLGHVQGLVAQVGVGGHLDVAPSQKHACQTDSQKADHGQHHDDENRASLPVSASN